jgi:hypothetical protein
MLSCDTVIDAADPVTDEPVRVTFDDGTATWQPESAVVFYGARADGGPSAAVCCGYLRFFATRENAEAFAAPAPRGPRPRPGPAGRPRRSARRSSARY